MKIKVVFEENCSDFKKLSRQEQHPEKRVRLIAMALLKDGKKIGEAAKAIGMGRHAVGKWYRRYKKDGLDGLNNLPRSGRKPNIPRDQEEDFIQKVIDLQATKTGGRITGYDIQDMALNEFGAAYADDSIYTVLNRLGLSWITSRSKHPKSDVEVQKAFKKTLNKPFSKACRRTLT